MGVVVCAASRGFGIEPCRTHVEENADFEL